MYIVLQSCHVGATRLALLSPNHFSVFLEREAAAGVSGNSEIFWQRSSQQGGRTWWIGENYPGCVNGSAAGG